MGTIIKDDMKNIFGSIRFWSAAAIIVICTVINLLSAVNYSKPVGAAGLFIYGNIIGNPMMYFLAPFIPAFIFGPLALGDINKGINKDMQEMTSLKKHLAARSISSFVAGAGIFIISFIIILGGCFIVDPAIRPIDFEPSGLFSEVYYDSSLLYILSFILYTAVFGGIFSFLSFGVGLATKSLSMAMTLPGIIYHGSIMLWYLADNPVLSWIHRLLPSYTYVIMVSETPDPWVDKAVKLAAVLVASSVLAIVGYSRIKKTFLTVADGSFDV